MKKTNDPAFPNPIGSQSAQETGSGLSKREYFIAAALQGTLSNPETLKEISARGGGYVEVIQNAFTYADAVIFKLNRGE